MNKKQKFLSRIKESFELFKIEVRNRTEDIRNNISYLLFNKQEWFFAVSILVSFCVAAYIFYEATAGL